MIHLAPVEPDQVEAVHALAIRPDVARWTGATPYDSLERWSARLTAGSHDTHHWLGAWRGERLAALARLQARRAARLHHRGDLQVLAEPGEAAVPVLLERVLEIADRWLALIHLRVDVDAEHPGLPALLTAAGFELEVTRRRARWRDGARRDGLRFSRVRPGWSQPEGCLRPAPAPPPRGERVDPARLSFRPLRASDLEPFAAVHRDDSVLWGTMVLPTMRISDWRERIGGNDAQDVVGITAVVDDELVGSLALFPTPPPDWRTAQLGLAISRPWQGRGVGGRLMAEAVEIAEGWLGYRRVELGVFPENTRARGLYRRLGFVDEGVERLHAWRDGGYADCVAMARVTG